MKIVGTNLNKIENLNVGNMVVRTTNLELSKNIIKHRIICSNTKEY